MIVGAHHVAITVPRGAEDEARAFYSDLLGLSEIEKPSGLKGRGGFWLQLGDIQLHISVEDGVDRLKTKAHVAFEVEDLAQVRLLLIKRGLEPQDGTPIPGYERFEVRDPFGNRLEFLERLGE